MCLGKPMLFQPVRIANRLPMQAFRIKSSCSQKFHAWGSKLLYPDVPAPTSPDSASSVHTFYYNRLFIPSHLLNRLVPMFVFTSESQLKSQIQKSQTEGTVVDIEPRPEDGGAFVRIQGELAPIDAAARAGINQGWLGKLFRRPASGFKVLGTPWVTDIPRRPCRVVKVSPNLSDEEIYQLMRPYGRIIRVENSQVTFAAIQDAITASYCAHRRTLGGKTEVRLALQESVPWFVKLRGWLSSHPRLVIPAAFAILFTIAYAVFEPIRELSVRTKIKGTLDSIAQYMQWARESSTKLINFGQKEDEPDQSPREWNKLANSSEQLVNFIEEGAPTFTILVGPKGSGKSQVLKQTLSNFDVPALYIDCEKLRAADEQDVIRNLAASLGYWPVFLWTNRLFKFAELGIQGVTGQSPGITESTEQQAQRMLTTAAAALRQVALRKNHKSASSPDSAYLESHPNELPVLVLQNFSSSEKVGGNMVASWAGELARKQYARVIIVTQDASVDKVLAQSLPNRVFQVVHVEDAIPTAAKEYVIRRFTKQATTPQAKAAIEHFSKLSAGFLEPLGGRFTDLQSFGRRLLNGDSPEHALSGLVHGAALEVSQLFLGEKTSSGDDKPKWTTEQAWTLVKLLANSPAEDWLSIPGKVAMSSAFAGSDVSSALEALESSGLITLRNVAGRCTGVKASRPLFRAAFSELKDDDLVANVMEARLAKFIINKEHAKIVAAEGELVNLAAAQQSGNINEIMDRQDDVASALAASQKKLESARKTLKETNENISKFGWYHPRKEIAYSFSDTADQKAGWFGQLRDQKPSSSFE